MNSKHKIFQSRDQLRTQLDKVRRPLVFTNGCFDVLPLGHLEYLEEARGLGDVLVVAINDDASDVGSVHFGLVNIAHCETADVVIRETHMMEGSFVSRSTLADIALPAMRMSAFRACCRAFSRVRWTKA